jgi:hypothetical protein
MKQTITLLWLLLFLCPNTVAQNDIFGSYQSACDNGDITLTVYKKGAFLKGNVNTPVGNFDILGRVMGQRYGKDDPSPSFFAQICDSEQHVKGNVGITFTQNQYNLSVIVNDVSYSGIAIKTSSSTPIDDSEEIANSRFSISKYDTYLIGFWRCSSSDCNEFRTHLPQIPITNRLIFRSDGSVANGDVKMVNKPTSDFGNYETIPHIYWFVENNRTLILNYNDGISSKLYPIGDYIYHASSNQMRLTNVEGETLVLIKN